ncbi:MAG TPA: transposase [Gaiellaceae bacterium]|nr:transposase [Gaiellaceae bacterium]
MRNLASWAAICPGTRRPGRKRNSGKTRRGDSWLRTALTQSARAADRSKDTYLASHYWQIRGRRGDLKAIGATRHDILIAYYYIVRDHVPYRELGPDWLARRHSPSTAPADSSNNSKRSATASRSRSPPDPVTRPASNRHVGPPARPLARGPTRQPTPPSFTP